MKGVFSGVWQCALVMLHVGTKEYMLSCDYPEQRGWDVMGNRMEMEHRTAPLQGQRDKAQTHSSMDISQGCPTSEHLVNKPQRTNRSTQYIYSQHQRKMALGNLFSSYCIWDNKQGCVCVYIYICRESDRYTDKVYNVVTQYVSGSSETVGVSTQLLLLTDPLKRHTT